MSAMLTVSRVGLRLVACLAVGCGAPEPPPPAEADVAEMTAPDAGAGTVLRVDSRLDALVPTNARIEKLADGFILYGRTGVESTRVAPAVLRCPRQHHLRVDGG